MNSSKFSESQIVAILKQQDAGLKVTEGRVARPRGHAVLGILHEVHAEVIHDAAPGIILGGHVLVSVVGESDHFCLSEKENQSKT